MRYGIRNLRHRMRGWKQELIFLAGVGIRSELSAVHFTGQGVVDLGVLSRRLITNNGVKFITDAFMNTVEAETMNFHDCGTGTTAEAVTDTALVTPYGGSRATGTQSEPSNGLYRSVGTISFTSTLAITEHGIFSAVSSGVLMDRSVFTAINVVNGDSIQFTYTITFTAGG